VLRSKTRQGSPYILGMLFSASLDQRFLRLGPQVLGAAQSLRGSYRVRRHSIGCGGDVSPGDGLEAVRVGYKLDRLTGGR
jgi:hypothetical protein